MTPYQTGIEASLSGRPRSDNPYDEGSDAHFEWWAGHVWTVAARATLDLAQAVCVEQEMR